MRTREWAYRMIDELTDEEFNALMAIVQVMHKNSQSVKKNSCELDEIMGIFHDVADTSKVPLEKTAWENAAVEKHLKFLEEMKSENT